MPKITSNADLYNSDYEELTACFELYEVLNKDWMILRRGERYLLMSFWLN